MLVNSRQVFKHFFSLHHVLDIFKGLYPFIPRRAVISSMNEEVKRLFNRLTEARTQVQGLKLEISDITKQIQLLSESHIFQEYLNDAADDNSFGDSTISAKRPADQLDYVPTKKLRDDFQRDGDYVIVYTDGACENNGKAKAKAGIGVWFDYNHPLNVSEPVKGKATNNTAEIQACTTALRVAKENGVEKIKIMTDSQFTINCITKWIHKWKKNNWKLAGGGDVINKGDLIKLDDMRKSMDVIWEHVPGHRGVKGNEEADKLARQGATRYKRHVR